MELVRQFRNALADGKANDMQMLVDQVADLDQSVAEVMRTLVQDYRYEDLERLLG